MTDRQTGTLSIMITENLLYVNDSRRLITQCRGTAAFSLTLGRKQPPPTPRSLIRWQTRWRSNRPQSCRPSTGQDSIHSFTPSRKTLFFNLRTFYLGQ